MNKNTIDNLNIETYFSGWVYRARGAKKFDVLENEDGSITIRPHKALSFAERQRLAHAVVGEFCEGRSFLYYNNVTVCVIAANNSPSHVGYSICKRGDRYSQVVGMAIAYERARYGKVIHEDLLGED